MVHSDKKTSSVGPDFEEALRACIQVLREGGILLYPTDTVWGLGCDATNANATARLFALKERPEGQPMLILVPDADMILRFVKEVPEMAWQILEVTDRPLTIVYPQGVGLAPNLLGPDGSIAIRVVQDPFCRELTRRLNRPIVSTSANLSGQPTPRFFDELGPEILNRVDHVARWRQTDHTPSVPSGIIRIGLKGEVEIIRKG